MIQVTEVKIEKVKHEKVLAYVDIVLNNEFAIKGIRLINIDGLIHLAMPDKEVKCFCEQCDKKVSAIARFCEHCGIGLGKQEKRNFRLTCHPINNETRERILQAVLLHY